MLETDNITITMTAEQAMSLKATLYAVAHNFQNYRGMNIGSSTIHNLFPEDVMQFTELADKLSEILEG